jgi:hypothetical protein
MTTTKIPCFLFFLVHDLLQREACHRPSATRYAGLLSCIELVCSLKTPSQIAGLDSDIRLCALHLATTSGRHDIVLQVLEEIKSYPEWSEGFRYEVFAINLQLGLAIDFELPHPTKSYGFLEEAAVYASAKGYERAVEALIQIPGYSLLDARDDQGKTLLDIAIENEAASLVSFLYESGFAYDCWRRGALVKLLDQQGVKWEHLLMHGLIPDIEIGAHWAISRVPIGLNDSDSWSALATRPGSENLLVEVLKAHGAGDAERFSVALSPDGSHYAMVVGLLSGFLE